jgi:hypothetical protein
LLVCSDQPVLLSLLGLVAFCIGCGGLIASMIVDGFVSPAIAARFAGTDGPQDLAMLLMRM